MRNPFRSTFGLQGLARAAGPLVPQLPQQGNLVAYWDAADIVGTNGATFAQWVDRINGISADQGTAGAQPTLKTNQVGGRSCASFNGSQYLAIATPGALKTAIDSYQYTVLIVARSNAAARYGCVFGAQAGGNSLYYLMDGTEVGRFSGGVLPYTAINQWMTFGATMTNQWAPYSASPYYEQIYVQGTPAAVAGGTGISSGNNAFGIGASGSGGGKCKNDVFAILVWDRALTPVEYLQAQMWACTRWGQPYPWDSVSRMVVFDGDSITAGVGASKHQFGTPYRVAQALGLSYGQWMNNGVGGATITQLASVAANRIDGIPALINKDVALVAWEWYNQRALTPPAAYNASLAYLTARKAASSRIKIVWGTSTDSSSDNATPANRNSYNAAWDSYWAGSHPLIDAYVPIHQNATIGAPGAYAAAPTTYWGDGVHPNDAGYAVLAPLFTAGVQALP